MILFGELVNAADGHLFTGGQAGERNPAADHMLVTRQRIAVRADLRVAEHLAQVLLEGR